MCIYVCIISVYCVYMEGKYRDVLKSTHLFHTSIHMRMLDFCREKSRI